MSLETNKPDPKEKDGAVDSITIEVDGAKKTYTAENIKNMLAQQASATQKNQSLAKVLKSIEKFDTDPDRYATEAEASFGIIHDLQQKGILDDNGELITKRTEPDPNDTQNRRASDSFMNRNNDNTNQNDNDVANIVAKALQPLQEQVEGMKKSHNSLLRHELDKEIEKRHPGLDKEARGKILDESQAGGSKSLWDLAKTAEETTKTRNAEIREEHAKEFGINLKEFDENKLNQQDGEGGRSVMFEGKKFSFGKKGKDSISPKQAMIQDFKQNPI